MFLGELCFIYQNLFDVAWPYIISGYLFESSADIELIGLLIDRPTNYRPTLKMVENFEYI